MDTTAPSKRSPVVIFMSTLAGLQVITAGSILTDVLGAKAAALLALLIAGAQVGVQFYVNGQVTVTSAVVAQRTEAGVVVAGPSAQAPTGVVVEEPAPVEAP